MLDMQGPNYPFRNKFWAHFGKFTPNAIQFHLSYTLTLTWSTEFIVNIAGILHHWLHLCRSGFVDSLDPFPVCYPIQIHKYRRQQNMWKLRHSILQEQGNQHDHDDHILHGQEHRNHRGKSYPCTLQFCKRVYCIHQSVLCLSQQVIQMVVF